MHLRGMMRDHALMIQAIVKKKLEKKIALINSLVWYGNTANVFKCLTFQSFDLCFDLIQHPNPFAAACH